MPHTGARLTLLAAGGATLASVGFSAAHLRQSAKTDPDTPNTAGSGDPVHPERANAAAQPTRAALALSMAGVAGVKRLYGDESAVTKTVCELIDHQSKLGALMPRLTRSYSEGLARGELSKAVAEAKRLEALVAQIDPSLLEAPIDPQGDATKTLGTALHAVANKAPSTADWQNFWRGVEVIERRLLSHTPPTLGISIENTVITLEDQLGMLTRPDYRPADAETAASEMSTLAASRLGGSIPGVSTARWLTMPHAAVAQEIAACTKQLRADRAVLLEWPKSEEQFPSMWGRLSALGREYVQVQSLAVADGAAAPTRVTIVSKDDQYILEAGKQYARVREGLFQNYRELMHPPAGGFEARQVLRSAASLLGGFKEALPATSLREVEELRVALDARDAEGCINAAAALMSQTFPEGPMMKGEIEAARSTLNTIATALDKDPAKQSRTAAGVASALTWALQCVDPGVENPFPEIRAGSVEHTLKRARQAAAQR